jgi:hypothetical protein
MSEDKKLTMKSLSDEIELLKAEIEALKERFSFDKQKLDISSKKVVIIQDQDTKIKAGKKDE